MIRVSKIYITPDFSATKNTSLQFYLEKLITIFDNILVVKTSLEFQVPQCKIRIRHKLAANSSQTPNTGINLSSGFKWYCLENNYVSDSARDKWPYRKIYCQHFIEYCLIEVWGAASPISVS